jgi:hypothetical protein
MVILTSSMIATGEFHIAGLADGLGQSTKSSHDAYESN